MWSVPALEVTKVERAELERRVRAKTASPREAQRARTRPVGSSPRRLRGDAVRHPHLGDAIHIGGRHGHPAARRRPDRAWPPDCPPEPDRLPPSRPPHRSQSRLYRQPGNGHHDHGPTNRAEAVAGPLLTGYVGLSVAVTGIGTALRDVTAKTTLLSLAGVVAVLTLAAGPTLLRAQRSSRATCSHSGPAGPKGAERSCARARKPESDREMATFSLPSAAMNDFTLLPQPGGATLGQARPRR